MSAALRSTAPSSMSAIDDKPGSRRSATFREVGERRQHPFLLDEHRGLLVGLRKPQQVPVDRRRHGDAKIGQIAQHLIRQWIDGRTLHDSAEMRRYAGVGTHESMQEPSLVTYEALILADTTHVVTRSDPLSWSNELSWDLGVVQVNPIPDATLEVACGARRYQSPPRRSEASSVLRRGSHPAGVHGTRVHPTAAKS